MVATTNTVIETFVLRNLPPGMTRTACKRTPTPDIVLSDGTVVQLGGIDGAFGFSNKYGAGAIYMRRLKMCVRFTLASNQVYERELRVKVPVLRAGVTPFPVS